MTCRRFLAILLLLLWYSIIGNLRANEFSDELALWTRATIVSPFNPHSHINRAKILGSLGREDEMVSEVDQGLNLELARDEK